MNIRGMTAFGDNDKHGYHGVTNFGSIADLVKVGLDYVCTRIIAYNNIFIALTGSYRIYYC